MSQSSIVSKKVRTNDERPMNDKKTTPWLCKNDDPWNFILPSYETDLVSTRLVMHKKSMIDMHKKVNR